LGLTELACAFDLPSLSHSLVDCHDSFRPLFPLKLLEAPLQHVLTTLVAKSAPGPSIPTLPPLTPMVVAPFTGQTWLPALGKFLPDAWSDETLISDKAAKADEAPVPSHLWDNRCKLVLPQLTDSALAGFRKLALIWQRKYMYKQFRAFLRDKFGPELVADSFKRAAPCSCCCHGCR
jgi:hypothetical protein